MYCIFGKFRQQKNPTYQPNVGSDPETNSEFTPESLDGWNTMNFPFGIPYFQGRTVSFREGSAWKTKAFPKSFRFMAGVFFKGSDVSFPFHHSHTSIRGFWNGSGTVDGSEIRRENHLGC